MSTQAEKHDIEAHRAIAKKLAQNLIGTWFFNEIKTVKHDKFIILENREELTLQIWINEYGEKNPKITLQYHEVEQHRERNINSINCCMTKNFRAVVNDIERRLLTAENVNKALTAKQLSLKNFTTKKNEVQRMQHQINAINTLYDTNGHQNYRYNYSSYQIRGKRDLNFDHTGDNHFNISIHNLTTEQFLQIAKIVINPVIDILPLTTNH